MLLGPQIRSPMNYNKVLNAQAAFVNHSVHRERDVDCFCVHVLCCHHPAESWRVTQTYSAIAA